MSYVGILCRSSISSISLAKHTVTNNHNNLTASAILYRCMPLEHDVLAIRPGDSLVRDECGALAHTFFSMHWDAPSCSYSR